MRKAIGLVLPGVPHCFVVEDEGRIAELLGSSFSRIGLTIDAVRLRANACEPLSVIGYDAAMLDRVCLTATA
jgi:DNA-binding response OmpR family regulator